MKQTKTKITKNRIVPLVLLALIGCDSGQHAVTEVYPDASTEAFAVFSKQCSLCHRPPMPNTHTAIAWESVVARMKQHKQERGQQAMSERESMQVLQYLQSHSKKE
jgi:cytochrome c5